MGFSQRNVRRRPAGSINGIHDRLENVQNMLAEAPGISIQAFFQ
jgi:hypothetical protein